MCLIKLNLFHITLSFFKMKRLLTPDEIEYILYDIRTEWYLGYPEALRKRMVERLTSELEVHLTRLRIKPHQLGLFKERMYQVIRQIEAGTAIGIITAQSIGELQTQMTLNTFHHAGITEKQVVSGVPRFNELIHTNHSKTQIDPSCFIYFKTDISIHELRTQIARQIVCISFETLVEHVSFDLFQPIETTATFSQLFTPPIGQLVLQYKINLRRIHRYRIRLDEICHELEKVVPECSFVFSPLCQGFIDVYSDQDCLEVHSKLSKIILCGLVGIHDIFFFKDEDRWYAETTGTNLEALLRLDIVDPFKTYSNNLWDIYDLFGIEGARAFLMFEFTKIMPNIDAGYVELVADRMTVSGKLRSISRYTRKTENVSVLSKATFEETLSNFTQAAFSNTIDPLVGCSASLICGKIASIGTGLNDLLCNK
jgi:DNA-directed RNA polymerase beta' subunit